MAKLFLNFLATLAEFGAYLIRMRTRKGMAIARVREKLHGKQRELCRMRATSEYSISDLAELFSVSRPIVYPHSTDAISLSGRYCPLPGSTRILPTFSSVFWFG